MSELNKTLERIEREHIRGRRKAKRAMFDAMKRNDLEWAANLHGELCKRLGVKPDYGRLCSDDGEDAGFDLRRGRCRSWG